MPRLPRAVGRALALLALGGGAAFLLWVVPAYRPPYAEPAIEPGRPTLDPGLVFRESALTVDFAGNGRGLLKLGKGWHQPRPRGTFDRWRQLRGVDPQADLFFARPPRGALSLVLAISALPGLDGEQFLSTRLNGVPVDRRPLATSHLEVAIPLPAAPLVAGINRIELRFERSAVPLELGLYAEDRPTAARVGSIRLALDGRTQEEIERRSSRLDGEGLCLRDRSPVELPIGPGESTATFANLGAAGASGATRQDATLRLDRVVGGETIALAEGPWDEVTAAPVALGAAATPGWLRIEALLPEGTERCLAVTTRAEAPARRSAEAPPDVVLVVVDTLRADALSLYGSPRPTSPEIDRIAAGAITFERATSTAGWTLPATMSLHSGTLPQRHGFVHAANRPRETPALLAERLRDAGYDTIGITHNLVAGRVFGFDRGFDTFFELDALGRSASESADVPWFLWHALAGRGPARPLFASVHLVDPHESYAPQLDDRRFAREYLGLLRPWQYQPQYFTDHGLEGNARELGHLRGLYDGEVRAADRQVGRLVASLEALGRFDESLFLLTADHGEEFGEHGVFGHGLTLYRELLHVPLVVRLPRGEGGGRRVAAPASLLDVVPTVLDVAGLPADAGLEGRSLVRPALLPERRRQFAESRPYFQAETLTGVSLRAVLEADLKCIAAATASEGSGRAVEPLRAFDPVADPGEKRNLADDPAVAARCREALTGGWSVEEEFAARRELGDEERATLRALGYL